MRIKEKILNNPIWYRLSQFIFAPGADFFLNKRITTCLELFPKKSLLLDVGCGPKSWLWSASKDPIGLDIQFEYSQAFLSHGGAAVTGSATELPFSNNIFEGIWCIGVFHHLNDSQVKDSIAEMFRVLQPDGHIVVMDAVLPNNTITRPIASFIRNADRGGFMRSEQSLKKLLPETDLWQTERYTYALTGLEMLQCVRTKTHVSR